MVVVGAGRRAAAFEGMGGPSPLSPRPDELIRAARDRMSVSRIYTAVR